MIEPQTLIKTVRKINYELGLRINQTKEVILEVTHGKVKLPDDFYVFNYAMICNQYTESVGYDGMAGGTNIQEVPYVEVPANINVCAPATVNCSVCNFNPCNHTAACPNNTCPTECPTATIPEAHDPLNPYGDTCIRPRVFMNCKGDKYELIQIINTGQTRTYSTLSPLKMRSSQEIDCDCPNLYVHSNNEGSIKGGFLFTTLDTCKVYLNYQGEMEDEIGRLLVPDHALLNEYYEYALKKRIIENLALNGEDVAQRLQIIVPNYKEARNNALSVVNTPNFREIEKIWSVNRKVQYFKYYDMFKS
jgi:hypothetical protein